MPSLDPAFSALADPTRRAILARLARGEATVLELGRPFKMSQPAISNHIKVLENAGLITRRVDGSRRPCRLSRHGLLGVEKWLEKLQAVLEKNYDRLDAVLTEIEPPNGEKMK